MPQLPLDFSIWKGSLSTGDESAKEHRGQGVEDKHDLLPNFAPASPDVGPFTLPLARGQAA